jgi:hypothetical protein
VGAIWFISVVIALWRVPARRRRYLPAFVVVFTLMCYAGIRLVSLHQVDALLYRRYFHGVKYDAVFELIGLAIAIVVCVTAPRARRSTEVRVTAPPRPRDTVEGLERDIDQFDARRESVSSSQRFSV